MVKKFELTGEFKIHLGSKVFRIKKIINGELGGFIEKEDNLNQYDNAWISSDALVYGDAQVSGNALVYGDALVSGNAKVYGDAQVSGNARVHGDALVSGNALVYGDALVSGNAQVSGDALVYGDAQVSGNAKVAGDASVSATSECVNITNLEFNFTALPKSVQIGCMLLTYEQWLGIKKEQAVGMGLKEESYMMFMQLVRIFYSKMNGVANE